MPPKSPARRRQSALRIGERSVPLDLTPQQEGDRDKRIEMRAGYRTHSADQHDENGPGCRRIAEQRERCIAPESRSPMMPEPTMVASRSAVPSPSAVSRRARLCDCTGSMTVLWRSRFWYARFSRALFEERVCPASRAAGSRRFRCAGSASASYRRETTLGLGSLCFRRVGQAPMRGHRLARQNGTNLVWRRRRTL